MAATFHKAENQIFSQERDGMKPQETRSTLMHHQRKTLPCLKAAWKTRGLFIFLGKDWNIFETLMFRTKAGPLAGANSGFSRAKMPLHF